MHTNNPGGGFQNHRFDKSGTARGVYAVKIQHRCSQATPTRQPIADVLITCCTWMVDPTGMFKARQGFESSRTTEKFVSWWHQGYDRALEARAFMSILKNSRALMAYPTLAGEMKKVWEQDSYAGGKLIKRSLRKRMGDSLHFWPRSSIPSNVKPFVEAAKNSFPDHLRGPLHLGHGCSGSNCLTGAEGAVFGERFVCQSADCECRSFCSSCWAKHDENHFGLAIKKPLDQVARRVPTVLNVGTIIGGKGIAKTLAGWKNGPIGGPDTEYWVVWEGPHGGKRGPPSCPLFFLIFFKPKFNFVGKC
jgi:hypothetical protein